MERMSVRSIYCCGCGCEVEARLTDGREIYPHRADLERLPFWICDACKNYVGCHRDRKEARVDESSHARPLGVIATEEMRQARCFIHGILDPLWQVKRCSGGCSWAKAEPGKKRGGCRCKAAWTRKGLYVEVTRRMKTWIWLHRPHEESAGWEYHTAEIRTIEEAREVYRVVREIAREGSPQGPESGGNSDGNQIRKIPGESS